MSEQEPDPVVVVGDLMLDEAWFGRRDRICPDAAAPVFRVQRRESALGGAARVARVLVGLGVPVQVVGVVGDDPAGREMLGLLQEHGIGVDGVVVGWSLVVASRLCTADWLRAVALRRCARHVEHRGGRRGRDGYSDVQRRILGAFARSKRWIAHMVDGTREERDA